ELGRAAGWDPLPLSIRDARRVAAPLRARVAAVTPPPAVAPAAAIQRVVLRGRGIVVTYDALVAVRKVDVELRGGEITARMGRNGCGKSSLLWALQGSGSRAAGSVDVAGVDPHTVAPDRARTLVGLVPQTPSDLLYLDTVGAELAQADAESGGPRGNARAIL